jgi:hypothetical protein
MRKFIAILVSVMFTTFGCDMSFAYGHANAWGHGSTYHAQGSDSTTRTNGYGGEATHTAGQGTSYENKEGDSAYHAEGSGKTTASNPYGGSATHTAGQGTSATSAYGGSAYHAEGSGTTTATSASGGTATHYQGVGTVGTTSSGNTVYASDHYGTAYGYHPPTTVAVYGAGCYNCSSGASGWAVAGAAVAGAAVGAAVASANTSAATANAYAAGAATANANNASATANAYNAGVAAGAASVTYSMGEIVATAPTGCVTPNVGGVTYYLCGNTWLQPSYGANGVYYRVVPAP